MAFKDRLKEARLSKNLTQSELGSLIGVAKSTITSYEKGYSEPDMSKIQQLMIVLAVDANYLWQDEMKSIETKIKSPTADQIAVGDKQAIIDVLVNAFETLGIIEPGGDLNDEDFLFFDGLISIIQAYHAKK